MNGNVWESWNIVARCIRCALKENASAGVTVEPALAEQALLVATRHDLGPLFDEGSRRAGIVLPPDCATELRKARRAAEIAGSRAVQECRAIVNSLNDRDITPVLLKGSWLITSVYSSPGLRPLSDLDLLVPHESLAVAAEALAGLGYVPYRPDDGRSQEWWTQLHNHWIYTRAGALPVELHWSLTPRHADVQLDVNAIIKRSAAAAPQLGRALALSPEDGFLYVAIHASKHQLRVPLRFAADAAASLGYWPSLDWQAIWAGARQASAEVDLALFILLLEELGVWNFDREVVRRAEDELRGRLSPHQIAQYAIEWPFHERASGLITALSRRNPLGFARALVSSALPSFAHLKAQHGQEVCGAWQKSYAALWLSHVRHIHSKWSAARSSMHIQRAAADLYREFKGRDVQHAAPDRELNPHR